MADIVIKKHNFEDEKNKLSTLVNKKAEDLSISTVATDGGLFGLGNHKVTGVELNSRIEQIQKRFRTLNTYHSETLTMFRQVYEVFDKLDKEYIDGIVGSVKAAGIASEQALNAQKDADRAIEALKLTVQKLEKYKDDLERVKHLQNVDELWQHYIDLGDTFNTLEGTVQTIWKFKENALETFEKLDLDITSILDFDNEVEKQIDEIRTSIMREKEEFQNLKNLLDSYDHLGDIDNIYADSEENKAKLKNVEKNIISANASIESNKTAIDENRTAIKQNFENLTVCLNKKQEQIENLKNQLDENFETNKNAIEDNFAYIQQDKSDIKILQSDVEEINIVLGENQDEIEQLQILLETEKQNNIEKQQYLLKNIKIAYAVAGGSALAIVINYILQILGIL